MAEPIVLRWPNCEHTLVFLEDGRLLRCTLTVRKSVSKTIDVPLPVGITREDIVQAWEAKEQDHNWKPIYTRDWRDRGKSFESVRVIDIPGKIRIVWYVNHKDDAPDDVCVCWSWDASDQDIISMYIPNWREQ